VNRKIAAFVALAVVLAVLFVGLGFWQLDRLDQRRARNAAVASRLEAPVVAFDQLRDSASFRRAIIEGSPDSENEIVLTGRSRRGSPGVYILTPMRRATNDTIVIVIRGWVYAPDAATVDLSRWREQRSVYTGYVASLPMGTKTNEGRTTGRKLRTLTLEGVTRLLPYPVASLYVVSQDSAGGTAPARLSMPPVDDGPHLSYAIQWFAFAAIALVGAGIVAFRARHERNVGATAA
jgi:surfeit locus 1 family protein